MMHDARKSNYLDAAVGQRIAALRRTHKMTQRQLAEAIAVTYQQLQKYERGLTRVSAGRMQSLALVLGVPVPWLFGAQETSPFRDEDNAILSFLASDEGQELNIAFCRIVDRNLRRKITALVTAIVE
jgi:transcriptional regulator with XRE-family HTH domain